MWLLSVYFELKKMQRAEMFIIFKYCHLIYSNSIQCGLLLLVPHLAQSKDLLMTTAID